MERFRMAVHLLRVFMVGVIGVWIFSTDCPAEQIQFADWAGIEETDAETNEKSKQIGTFAKDGISSLWLAASATDEDRLQLILKSEKKIASDYFWYRVDRIDTLTIRSAQKGCDTHCLIDDISKNGELVKTMRRGLRIQFEYDSLPDTARKPTFSLRGFSKAYNWLLGDQK